MGVGNNGLGKNGPRQKRSREKTVKLISRVALYQASVSGLCDGQAGHLSARRSVCPQTVLWQNG